MNTYTFIYYERNLIGVINYSYTEINNNDRFRYKIFFIQTLSFH